MARIVLDGGGVSRLAEPSTRATELLRELRGAELWPPVVPVVVLIECLTGHPGRDANINRFLRTCVMAEDLPTALARRAASLRFVARRGSAVDALVVACAEPDGVVLTSDVGDLRALAAYARGVEIVRA